jgi:hypothetical protein
MRPDASPDPAVETLEELADVGAFIILAPAPQEWVKGHDQLRGFQRYPPFGSLPDLVHKTSDRLLLGLRIQRTLSGLATDLIRRQMELLRKFERLRALTRRATHQEWKIPRAAIDKKIALNALMRASGETSWPAALEVHAQRSWLFQGSACRALLSWSVVINRTNANFRSETAVLTERNVIQKGFRRPLIWVRRSIQTVRLGGMR